MAYAMGVKKREERGLFYGSAKARRTWLMLWECKSEKDVAYAMGVKKREGRGLCYGSEKARRTWLMLWE